MHSSSPSCDADWFVSLQPIIRPTRRFNTLKVPRKLQAALPFASKPKMQKPQTNKTYLQKRAVVMEADDKKAVSLLQQIQAINKAKIVKRKDKKVEKKVERKKKIDRSDEGRAERERADKKEHFKKKAGEEKTEKKRKREN